MNKTSIEYLDYSWNPIAMRCTPISEGCANCWHLAMAKRMAANPKIAPEHRAAYAGECGPTLIASRLDEPGKLRKSAIIGVQFMGDLFHEDVPSQYIKRDIWNAMVEARQQTFMLLTKRPKRALKLLGNHTPWPDNIWFGVTVANQRAADDRRDDFEAMPAALKFVSYEPSLGMVDWAGWEFVDWLISGGESGPGAQPSHPDWHRGARDFCLKNGIAYFFKQWGEFAPCRVYDSPNFVGGKVFEMFVGTKGGYQWLDENTLVYKCGKKATGHLLDGREWREFPGRKT